MIGWRQSKPRRVVKVTSELALHAPSRLRPVGHTPSSTQNFAVGEEHGSGRFRFALDASPRPSWLPQRLDVAKHGRTRCPQRDNHFSAASTRLRLGDKPSYYFHH